MLRIKRMQSKDIPFALRLTDQENWGITRNTLSRLMRLTPRGCFIAYDGTERVGLTTTTTYGRQLAWIGNVIVDNKHRGKHVGQNMVEHAVSFLRKSDAKHIALYCFKEHRKFYENLGFVNDKTFLRLRLQPTRLKHRKDHEISGPPPLNKIMATDSQAFGADRSRLIRAAATEKGTWYLGTSSGTSSNSYIMVREGRDDSEFGPWICASPQLDEPDEMLRRALTLTKPVPIEVSCLQDNRQALRILKTYDFRMVKEGHRMFFDRKARIGNDSWQFALGFLDKG